MAPISFANAGIRFSGRPRVTSSRPSRLSRSVAQRVVEELQPTRARRCLQPWVEHVAGEHLTIGGRGVEQGRQVVQSQIAAEPQQRGHAIDAARNSL